MILSRAEMPFSIATIVDPAGKFRTENQTNKQAKIFAQNRKLRQSRRQFKRYLVNGFAAQARGLQACCLKFVNFIGATLRKPQLLIQKGERRPSSGAASVYVGQPG
jgi:hypothetical protein